MELEISKDPYSGPYNEPDEFSLLLYNFLYEIQSAAEKWAVIKPNND
jgi:hypothetical protein